MIATTIFDFGGVLIRTEDDRPRRALEAQLGLSPRESEELVFNSEMGVKAQKGEVTTEALWSWVQGELGLDPAGMVAFIKSFWGGDVLDQELVNFIRSLRPHYQTAMISNATDTLRESLTDNWRIADAFDLLVVSAEEKVMKPDPEIYWRALNRLGRRPDECVFVDDNLENIQAAAKIGMQVVHYRPEINLPATLQEILS